MSSDSTSTIASEPEVLLASDKSNEVPALELDGGSDTGTGQTPDIAVSQSSVVHVCDDTLTASCAEPNAGDVIKPAKTEKTSRKDGGTSKRHKERHHKEDRTIEHVLKAVHSLKTPEERLAAVCKKYTDLLEENRTSQAALKQSERRAIQLVKEKEQLQTDHSKAILATSRLEGLCRELQKQCKIVKEEGIQRVQEEEEKRKDVSAKFQTTLAEISMLMQENNQMNSVLREQNLELSQKLKSLVEQYELREQQVDKVVKHKELELQLAEAKLAKANMLLAEDKERHLREKQKLLGELTECQRRCTELASNEVQLRTQLAVYTDKYTEFQETLAKSNQVFVSFKAEMEKMSKKIKKLEKETGSWKSRWENSNRALLEMTEDKQKHDLALMNHHKRVTQLEKLCRALQAENTSLRKQAVANATENDIHDVGTIQNGSVGSAADKEIQSTTEVVPQTI